MADTKKPENPFTRKKSNMGSFKALGFISKLKKSVLKTRSARSKGVRRDQARSRRNSIAPPALEDEEEGEKTSTKEQEGGHGIPTVEETHKLAPMETLLDVLGEHSTLGIRKNDVVDLSDPSYRISSDTLQEIHYISANGTDRSALDTVTDMYLSYNHIDTLLPLALVSPLNKKQDKYSSVSTKTQEKRAFQNLEIILADHNYIRWMCPGYRGQLNYHAWPYEMTKLIHLGKKIMSMLID
jgi:hypothetical protein